MTRFTPAFIGLFLTLTACGPGPSSNCEGVECNDGTGTDPDCCSTTGDVAYIGGVVNIDNAPVVCQVAVYDPEKSDDEDHGLVGDHFTDDGSSVPVQAGKTYRVCAGNPNILDTKNNPLHTEPDDSVWRANCVDIVGGTDETTDPEFDLDIYFHLVDVECSVVDYFWQNNAWVEDDVYVVGTRTLEVLEDSRVIANDFIDGGGTLDEKLVTSSDGFDLIDTPTELYIESEMISNDSFVLTLIAEEWSREVLTCE